MKIPNPAPGIEELAKYEKQGIDRLAKDDSPWILFSLSVSSSNTYNGTVAQLLPIINDVSLLTFLLQRALPVKIN